MTIHRGIMHSIPFSFLCAEITYLLFDSADKNMSTMAASAVFFGCFIHLILDELHAIYFKFGFIPMLKKSSGTALKLYTNGFTANFMMFSSLVFMTALIILNH